MAMFKRLSTVIIVYLLFSNGVASEPSCSRFDYEEKILEKMVRMEFKLEQFSDMVKELKNDLSKDVGEIRKEVDTIKSDLLKWEKDIVNKTTLLVQHKTDELQEKVVNISMTPNGVKDESTVLFSAATGPVTNPRPGDTLIYRTVEINDGIGYTQATGKFTAPFPGLYAFTVNICIDYKVHVYYAIVKNDTPVSYVVFHDEDIYPSSNSGTAFVKLNKGEQVWVKCMKVENRAYTHLYDDATCKNRFNGVLLRRLENA